MARHLPVVTGIPSDTGALMLIVLEGILYGKYRNVFIMEYGQH